MRVGFMLEDRSIEDQSTKKEKEKEKKESCVSVFSDSFKIGFISSYC